LEVNPKRATKVWKCARRAIFVYNYHFSS